MLAGAVRLLVNIGNDVHNQGPKNMRVCIHRIHHFLVRQLLRENAWIWYNPGVILGLGCADALSRPPAEYRKNLYLHVPPVRLTTWE